MAYASLSFVIFVKSDPNIKGDLTKHQRANMVRYSAMLMPIKRKQTQYYILQILKLGSVKETCVTISHYIVKTIYRLFLQTERLDNSIHTLAPGPLVVYSELRH